MDFDCNVMYAVWLPRTAMRFHQNRPSALYSYTMTKNRKDKPKLYLGWHIVAGAFTLIAPNYGARYSFGIFVQPLTADNGWSRSVMAALIAFVHQVPYAVGQGIDRMAPAASLGAMGFAGLLGRFFFGWISDRMGDPKYSAALGYAFMVVGTALLLETRTVEMLLAYSLVFGFGYGCLGPLLPIIAADRFARQRMGATFGLLTFFVVGVGGSLGPLAGGLIYDATGSYRYAWWLVLVSLAGAIAGIVSMKRHA